MTTPSITQQRMAAIFEEWAARHATNPNAFDDFLADGRAIIHYGTRATLYFEQIAAELDAANKLPRPAEHPLGELTLGDEQQAIQDLQAAQEVREHAGYQKTECDCHDCGAKVRVLTDETGRNSLEFIQHRT